MKSTQQLIAEYLDIHAQRRKVLAIITAILLVVAFVVVSVTIFPAITMQGDDETICGLEEHTHTADCYTQKLICKLPEVEEHHHGETCYEKQLKCENTEESHEHTDECYENVLICGAEETDGHTHTDECYEKELNCDIAEHTHTQECYPEDKAIPLDKLKIEGNCYKAVSSLEAFGNRNASYIIVSPDANGAVMLDKEKANLDELQIETILGNDNAYRVKTSDAKDITKRENGIALKWNIIVGDNQATVRNASDGRYYINLKENNVVGRDSAVVTLDFNKKQGTWTITQKVDGVIRYLSNTDEGVINTNDPTVGNTGWLIFKLSDSEIKKNSNFLELNNDTPNTDASSLVKKPVKTKAVRRAKAAATTATKVSALNLNDSGYVEPSSSKTGEVIYRKKLLNYSSDPASSQIESQFKGVKTDDGKVLVDKSVIYGGDDYGAFDNYGYGTFGVELSVLAQQYNVLRKKVINIPVDVVFIVDTSGSMLQTQASSRNQRITSAVNALNPAIDKVLKANSNNRVGIVKFSNTSATMIPLDFYSPKDNGKYVSFSGSQVTASMTKQSGGTVTASTSGNSGTNTATDWGGTYTQHGIARANQEFQNITDTTYTDQDGKQVARKPVVILLTDGDPTFCTSNYSNVLSGPHYGNGVGGDTVNNKGVLGYYTVLSAVSYKQKIAAHYNNKLASFYTIGIGIDPVKNEVMDQSVSGHNYTRAVLNPTKENVAAANNPSITNNSYCGGMFNQLMNNTYTSSTVTIGSDSNTAVGATSSRIPVIQNPYLNSGYSYADGAYFGEMTTAELDEVFQNIIETSIQKVEYGFNLKQYTAAELTDPIGKGMEVKGDPVLRYNGKNYNFTEKRTTNKEDGSTVLEYIYSYTATDENIIDAEGNPRKVNLSYIDVTVVTDKDGNQTVKLAVPEGCMPAYAPNFEAGTYYEELPARLIFQVGITDEALANAKAGDVFYTNRWENGEQAIATMYPDEANPYYENGVGPYQDTTAAKTENTTKTNANSNKYIASDGQSEISVELGNNGKLVLAGTKENIKITAQKKWQDENGTEITDTSDFPEVTFTLYRKLNEQGAKERRVDTVVLGNQNGWQYVWDKLPYCNDNDVPYIYFIREVTPDGYIPTISGPVSAGDGTILVTNKKIPEKGALAVKKVWQNYLGNPVSDMSLLNDIDVKLYRHVEIAEPQSVTVTINAGGNLLRQIQVRKGTDVTFTLQASYSSTFRSMYAAIQKNGATISSDRSGATRTTSLQTITANSDVTVNYDSSRYNANSWTFASGPSYTASTGTGAVTQGEDEYVDTVTLGNSNNWQYLWENLVVSEEKDDGKIYTYSYYVEEDTKIPGYTTSYSDGNTTGVQGGEITVTNKSDYYMDIMPETGSIGTGVYILGGLVSVIVAVAGLWKGWCVKRQKRGTHG